MVGCLTGGVVLAGVASVTVPALASAAARAFHAVGGTEPNALCISSSVASEALKAMLAVGGIAICGRPAFLAGKTAAVSLSSVGPVGLIVLGAELETKSTKSHHYTYDCWKPILHDSSPEPSQGVLLKEVLLDPRIKHVEASFFEGYLPEIVLRNVWEEEFQIQYVVLPDDQLAAHAVRLQHAETIQNQ